MKIPNAEGTTNIEQNVLTYTKPNDTEIVDNLLSISLKLGGLNYLVVLQVNSR